MCCRCPQFLGEALNEFNHICVFWDVVSNALLFPGRHELGQVGWLRGMLKWRWLPGTCHGGRHKMGGVQMGHGVGGEEGMINGHKIAGRASDVGCVGCFQCGAMGSGGKPFLSPESIDGVHVGGEVSKCKREG